MQVLAGFGDGINYYFLKKGEIVAFFGEEGAVSFLPFHTPHSSQKSRPYFSNTH